MIVFSSYGGDNRLIIFTVKSDIRPDDVHGASIRTLDFKLDVKMSLKLFR